MAYRKPTEELGIVTKTYNVILWSCNHTRKFSRNHRFVLGERIERNLYELLETLSQTKGRHIAEESRLVRPDSCFLPMIDPATAAKKTAAGFFDPVFCRCFCPTGKIFRPEQ